MKERILYHFPEATNIEENLFSISFCLNNYIWEIRSTVGTSYSLVLETEDRKFLIGIKFTSLNELFNYSTDKLVDAIKVLSGE